MGRFKLKRHKDLKNYTNVLENPQNSSELWDFINQKNQNIFLELGCGHGAYVIELSKIFPSCFVIGLDVKGDRLWKGAKHAKEQSLVNAYFLRSPIERIETLFPKESIDEIWITFPDPFPKKRHAKHRLTHDTFLDKYAKLLKQDGVLHLKTDDESFFHFTIMQIENHPCFHLNQLVFDTYHTNPPPFPYCLYKQPMKQNI